MKTITLFTLFILFVSPVNADKSIQTAENLTEWMTPSDYQVWFDSKIAGKKGYYPIFVEGRLINGKEKYRAIITLIPQDKFSFWTHHGISDTYYKRQLEALSQKGYVIISHQTFVDMEGNTRHQATWARTPSRTNTARQTNSTESMSQNQTVSP